MKKSVLNKQLCNNVIPRSILGMSLTNANGALDVSSAGYEYIISTLSEIRSQIITQKFYKTAAADYMTVDVGEAAWKEEIVQNIKYDLAGSFYEGDVDDMSGNGRITNVDAALNKIRMTTAIWARGAQWNISEISQAAAAGNWDVVASKMETLKTNWDLGIQETAFLGHPNISTMTGLLNDSEVTINTTLITKPLSDMTETEYTAFLKGLLTAYWENSQNTEMPDTFIIPSDDYLGLGVPYSSTYTTIAKIDYLENMLKKMTANENFKVLPLAYSQDSRNTSRGINKNRYVLYKNDPDTLKMTIPVDFTMFDASTTNGIFWQQPAIGQYSGVLINRKPEVLYLDETAA